MLTNLVEFVSLFLIWLSLASYGTDLLYFLVQEGNFLGIVAEIRTKLDREIPRKSTRGKMFEFGKKWLYNFLGGCPLCFKMWHSLWFFVAFWATANYLGCFVVPNIYPTIPLLIGWLGMIFKTSVQKK